MDRLSRILTAVVAVLVLAVVVATFLPNGDEEEPSTTTNETATAACRLPDPGSPIGMELPGCDVLASDTASDPDPRSFWGEIDCEEKSRHRRLEGAADTHPRADGAPQGDKAYRRLTVREGDRVFGERCELGLNNENGPTVFYAEGERLVTYISIRLPGETDPATSKWRTVLQMKQTQPYNNPDLSPAFELQVRDGEWVVESSWKDLWYTAAEPDRWTRFAFDITYSSNPNVGRINAYVDLNGDGDFTDRGERSPKLTGATLRAETAAGAPSPYGPGQSIPSHLRAGIYQDPDFSCPRGCSVDIDNVQVISE